MHLYCYLSCSALTLTTRFGSDQSGSDELGSMGLGTSQKACVLGRSQRAYNLSRFRPFGALRSRDVTLRLEASIEVVVWQVAIYDWPRGHESPFQWVVFGHKLGVPPLKRVSYIWVSRLAEDFSPSRSQLSQEFSFDLLRVKSVGSWWRIKVILLWLALTFSIDLKASGMASGGADASTAARFDCGAIL